MIFVAKHAAAWSLVVMITVLGTLAQNAFAAAGMQTEYNILRTLTLLASFGTGWQVSEVLIKPAIKAVLGGA